MSKNEFVILLHGHMRTAADTRKMKRFLESYGYALFAPTLPTIFSPVDDCTDRLEKMLLQVPLEKYKQVHFVGHSMGGLIIRKYLSRNQIPNLGRCVLIATPNQGSELPNLFQ